MNVAKQAVFLLALSALLAGSLPVPAAEAPANPCLMLPEIVPEPQNPEEAYRPEASNKAYQPESCIASGPGGTSRHKAGAGPFEPDSMAMPAP